MLSSKNHSLHDILPDTLIKQVACNKSLFEAVNIFLNADDDHEQALRRLKEKSVLKTDSRTELLQSLQSRTLFTSSVSPTASCWLSKKDDSACANLKDKGNDLFRSGNDLAALSTYNEALRFCRWDNACFPILIANRSACLIRMQLYQLCVQEIEQALALGYPIEKSTKLTTRRDECMKHLSTPKADRPQSWDSIERLSSVEVVNTEAKGRCAVAKATIGVGETVLEDIAYSCVPLEASGLMVCDHCLQRLADGVNYYCPLCVGASYCSLSCARQAFDTYHNLECLIRPQLHNAGFVAHLAARLICTARQTILRTLDQLQAAATPAQLRTIDLQFVRFSRDAHYEALCSLVDHRQQIGTHVFDAITQGVRCAGWLLKVGFFAAHTATWQDAVAWQRRSDAVADGNAQPAGAAVAQWRFAFVAALLAKHQLQIICNGHAVQTYREQPTSEENLSIVEQSQQRIGSALYVHASMLNHSCVANATAHFRGRRIIVMTSRAVAAGEEVTLCYGIQAQRMPVWERKDALLAQYFFACTCAFCADPRLEAPWHGLCCQFTPCDGLLYYDKCPSSHHLPHNALCDRCLRLQPFSYHLHRRLVKLFVDKVHGATLTAECLAENFAAWTSIISRLPPKSVSRGSCYDQLARLCWEAGLHSDAVRFVKMSIEIVEYAFGPDAMETFMELDKLFSMMQAIPMHDSLERVSLHNRLSTLRARIHANSLL